MKRKIIEFITNLSDGGAENLIKDYALLIDKSKFDICVVTIRNYTHTAVYKTLKDNDIKIIPVYPKWNIIIKIFNKILGRYYINWRLKSIFNQETAEVIHAHLYTLKYLHRIKENLAGIKLFYTCHSLPRVYLGGVEGAIAKELHQSNGLRIIALHEDMRKEINELLDIDDTVIIRNGIDFNRYINAEEGGKNVRDMLRIPSDAFVLGHVGRFHYVKNHDLLVKIFVQFSKYNPNAFLLMIGDGDEKERIRQKLIHLGMEGKFLILSNRTDVPELMRAMDVFVFPSRFEGLGIVLVEAQLSGLRCVVSDAVPQEVLLTDQIVKVGLDAPAEIWCDAISDKSKKGTPYGNIEDYDMNKEIKKLEQLYLYG